MWQKPEKLTKGVSLKLTESEYEHLQEKGSITNYLRYLIKADMERPDEVVKNTLINNILKTWGNAAENVEIEIAKPAPVSKPVAQTKPIPEPKPVLKIEPVKNNDEVEPEGGKMFL